MSASAAPAPSSSRLRRLLDYLGQDPTNLPLIADAAATALDEGEPIEAARLLDRYASLAPLTPALENLNGLLAIERQEFEVRRHPISGSAHAKPG